MKKVLVLIAVVMMTLGMNAEVKNINAFSEVKVNVPARVRVIRGSQYGINLSAEDSLLTSAIRYSVEKIRYSVENGTLSINTIDETLLLAEGSEVVITITAPEMPSFKTGRDFEARTKSVD